MVIVMCVKKEMKRCDQKIFKIFKFVGRFTVNENNLLT